jgi:hypothetical protein
MNTALRCWILLHQPSVRPRPGRDCINLAFALLAFHPTRHSEEARQLLHEGWQKLDRPRKELCRPALACGFDKVLIGHHLCDFYWVTEEHQLQHQRLGYPCELVDDWNEDHRYPLDLPCSTCSCPPEFKHKATRERTLRKMRADADRVRSWTPVQLNWPAIMKCMDQNKSFY